METKINYQELFTVHMYILNTKLITGEYLPKVTKQQKLSCESEHIDVQKHQFLFFFFFYFCAA